MNGKEFSVWLSGALELGSAKSFNEKQCEIIKAHLELVFENPQNVTPFTAWIKGVFDFSDASYLDEESVSKIKEELSTIKEQKKFNFMSYKSFCYWLQGAFEILELVMLDEEQTNQLKNKIFKEVIDNIPRDKCEEFCDYLKGYLLFSSSKEMNYEVTMNVRDNLNSIFTHVVNINKQTHQNQGMALDSTDVSVLIRC